MPLNNLYDARLVSSRLERTRGIYISPWDFAFDGREELTPEHEDDLIAEYGFNALVRYYAPNDDRLEPLEAV